MPPTDADALWNHARDVDASYVSTVTAPGVAREWERFIFYRGLGEAPLPIQARVGRRAYHRDHNGTGRRPSPVRACESRTGADAFSYAPALTTREGVSQSIPTMAGALPLDQFVERVSDAVAQRLTESGLYAKEARAMVNTWKSSYFKTDGVRLLFVLPQSWTDRFIPMRITPRPAQLVRVMVGRVELLSEERERAPRPPSAAWRRRTRAFGNRRSRYCAHRDATWNRSSVAPRARAPTSGCAR